MTLLRSYGDVKRVLPGESANVIKAKSG